MPVTYTIQSEIMYLNGVGPKRAELLANEIGIRIIEDLLYYFPYRYVDKTVFHKISEIHADLPYIQSAGIITEFIAEGQPANPRLIAKFTDGTGVLDLIWFKGVKWIRKGVKTGVKYIIFGKPVIYNKRINVAHPEIEELSKYEAKISSPFQGLYNTTEKLKASFITSKTIQNFLQNLFKVLSEIPETLPDFFVEKYSLLPLHEALFQIHFPANAESLKKARYRLKFEELFFIQLNLLLQKNLRNARYKGFVFEKIGDFFNTFYKKNLSFELTEAQKRVTKEIRIDVKSGRQMNRLLQGDVGSGKTLVALMTMLMAADNGFQSCIMAPTEILAQQHYQTITRFLEGIEINVHLLTGSTTKKQRTIIHDDLLTGKNNILIGTHALIEENVQFRNLGLVIIDEQHRFGVAQRAKLQVKNENPPHVLVMTATPIPRTLAMTLYGDLDVSVIDELPPGRKPIKTIHFFDSKRLLMFGFLKEQIRKGRQTYIVYPLISESEKMALKYLEDGVESISRAFPPPEYAFCVVHGRMKPKEKEASMKLFAGGISNILIATTVIEVGVDVPNATVMVIENAERFGLSQLHQLRGRVGRGTEQSYCILMTNDHLNEESMKRISMMVRTNDGFEIAEADLQLRGPGDIEGTVQSGMPFDLKIAELGKDGQILQSARNAAEKLLHNDPLLQNQAHQLFMTKLKAMRKKQADWSRIS